MALKRKNILFIGMSVLIAVGVYYGVKLFKVRYIEPTIPMRAVGADPKQVVILRGSIDPRLQIIFKASYMTHNPSCERDGSFLDGASSAQVYDVIYHPVIANGKYIAKIPTNAFVPGKCNWQFDSIFFNLSNDKKLKSGWGMIASVASHITKTDIPIKCSDVFTKGVPQNFAHELVCTLQLENDVMGLHKNSVFHVNVIYTGKINYG